MSEECHEKRSRDHAASVGSHLLRFHIGVCRMKPIKFPGHKAVAGVDQGYAPLPFRKDIIKVRNLGKVFEQPQLLFAFRPSEDELAAINAGHAIYLSLWHNVIPPMQMFTGPTNETLPVEISADINDKEAYANFVRLRDEGWHIHVFLDGEEQRQCSYAHRVRGIVRRAVLDEHGDLVREGDDYKTEEVTGKVHFELERVA